MRYYLGRMLGALPSHYFVLYQRTVLSGKLTRLYLHADRILRAGEFLASK